MRWWCGAAPQPLRRWPHWRNARRWPSNDASRRGVDLMKYDVIVIGAGSAGCVMASRLSEDPRASVLLLEAGPDYPTFAHLPDDLKLGNNVWLSAYGPHNWGYVAQLTPQQNRLTIPRGKVTGGSSAVNGQVLYRGIPEDALIGIRGLMKRVAQGAHPATLYPACARCERTRRSPGRAGVSLEKYPDADEANCATATRSPPSYSHALHKTRRHLHRGRIHPVHG